MKNKRGYTNKHIKNNIDHFFFQIMYRDYNNDDKYSIYEELNLQCNAQPTHLEDVIVDNIRKRVIFKTRDLDNITDEIIEIMHLELYKMINEEIQLNQNKINALKLLKKNNKLLKVIRKKKLKIINYES